MFDVAAVADGSAAVVLTRPELLPPDFPHPLIRVAASSLVTDTLSLHDRTDPMIFQAARLSVERACRQARVTPLQMDLFELYDAYSIYTVLSLEAAGFADRGEGMPISTMGGLKARGNPGGATGVYQAVEAALQLRGQAGDNQIQDARRAMIQCLGGPASTAVTHVLELTA
jgi:acetyl-CoA C-acetyltransferase